MWLLIAKIESPGIYLPRTKRDGMSFSQNYKGQQNITTSKQSKCISWCGGKEQKCLLK